jgi:transporter family protein
MERWILYALLSMGFAGVTAVIAKIGLSHITGELGWTVRTVFVLLFILLFTAVIAPINQFRAVRWHNIGDSLYPGLQLQYHRSFITKPSKSVM